MTSIATNVKHNIRTRESEHQGKTSISDPDQNLGFLVFFHQVCKNGMFVSESDLYDERLVNQILILQSAYRDI